MKSGKLTISQTHSNQSKDYIKIQLVNMEHKHEVHIEIDFKEFAQTLTGLGDVDCEYVIFD